MITLYKIERQENVSREVEEYSLVFLSFLLENVLLLLCRQRKYMQACVCNITASKSPNEGQKMKKKNEIEAAAVAIVFPPTTLPL
jgi:hypothetical protein